MVQIKKVFVVDDDLEDQEIFSYTVKNLHAPVSCSFARDGTEAIEILKRNNDFKPDYIFIDINMPRMNGVDLLKEIKLLNLAPHSQLVIHSTNVSAITVAECKRLGVNEFIVKSSSFNEMRNRLELLFNG